MNEETQLYVCCLHETQSQEPAPEPDPPLQPSIPQSSESPPPLRQQAGSCPLQNHAQPARRSRRHTELCLEPASGQPPGEVPSSDATPAGLEPSEFPLPAPQGTLQRNRTGNSADGNMPGTRVAPSAKGSPASGIDKDRDQVEPSQPASPSRKQSASRQSREPCLQAVEPASAEDPAPPEIPHSRELRETGHAEGTSLQAGLIASAESPTDAVHLPFIDVRGFSNPEDAQLQAQPGGIAGML